MTTRRSRRDAVERVALGLETLEQRLLFAFDPLDPYSGMAHLSQEQSSLSAVGEFIQHLVPLTQGQVLTGLLVPQDSALRLGVTILDEYGFQLATAQSAAAGGQVHFEPLAITTTGLYRVEVRSLEGSGPYSLDLLLNAEFEAESIGGAANDSPVNPQDIEQSLIDVAGLADRLSVIGIVGDMTYLVQESILVDQQLLLSPILGLVETASDNFLATDGQALYRITPQGAMTTIGGLSQGASNLAVAGGFLYTTQTAYGGAVTTDLLLYDQSTATYFDRKRVTSAAGTVLEVTALAAHPTQGKLYATFDAQNWLGNEQQVHVLGVIDTTTGVAEIIGALPERMSGLTAHPSGDLYAVTGNLYGEGFGLPSSLLYRIDTASAFASVVGELDPPGSSFSVGHEIAFRAADNKFYRMTGGGPNNPVTFRSVEVARLDDPVDHFGFELHSGETLTLVLSSDSTAVGVELIGLEWESLALGTSHDTTRPEAIIDFVAPSTGRYMAKVTGSDRSNYSLVIARDTGLEIGDQDDDGEPNPIGTTLSVLGHVGPIDDRSRYISGLPVTRSDGDGYLWDIGEDGSIIDGSSDAFDGGFYNELSVTTNLAGTEGDGAEYVLGPFDLGSGISYTRKVYVSPELGFARFLDSYTNSTATAINRPVSLTTNLGSDNQTVALGTSSGDSTVSTADDWLVTDDNGFDPAVGHVVSGASGARPMTFSLTGDRVDWAFDLQLDPGQTRSILTFGLQDFDPNRLLARIANFTDPTPVMLAWMSTDEIASVANFSLTGRTHWDRHTITIDRPTTLTLSTSTPLLGGNEPGYDLYPLLQLFGPQGQFITQNAGNAADGWNAEVIHPLTEPGTYDIVVVAADGSGAYHLNVVASDPQAIVRDPFEVIASDLPVNTTVTDLPRFATFNLSDAVLLTTIGPDDLRLIDPNGNVVSATAVDAIHGDQLRFAISQVNPVVGTYRFEIAAGAMTDLRGQPIDGAAFSLNVVRRGPQVVTITPANNATVLAGTVTLVATFDESLSLTQLGPEDVRLKGTFFGQELSPTTFSYDAANRRLTVTYPIANEDLYEFKMLSGANQFEGLFGNWLDGDGDGTFGGDYVTRFAVALSNEDRPLTFDRVAAAAGGVHLGRSRGAIATQADQDGYVVELDGSQTLSLVVWPTATLQPRVRVVRVSDGTTIAEAEGQRAGEAAIISSAAIATAGRYRVIVSGVTPSIGGYDLDAVLNAAIEAEGANGVLNNSLATAESLNPSFINFPGGGSRGAVVGSLPADGSGADWYAFSIEAGQTVTITASGSGIRQATIGLFEPTGEAVAYTTLPADPKSNLQKLVGYRAESSGTLYLSVKGAGDYAVVVTREITLDIEPNSFAAIAQPLTVDRGVLGSLQVNESDGAGRVIRAALLTQGYMTADRQLNDDTYFDFTATLVTTSEIDTLAELNAFDVLVIGDQGSRNALNSLGPVIRQWVEGGGGIVATGWTVYTASGNAEIDAILPINLTSSFNYRTNATVVITDPTHPVTEGVGSFVTPYLEFAPAGVDAWGVTRAQSSVTPAVVTGEPGLGRAVYLGPIFSESVSYTTLTSGPADRLFEQAVAWAGRGGIDKVDQYSIFVRPGDALTITTSTPGDGPGLLTNDLDPILELYRPDGTLVASNNNWEIADGGDGRNSRLIYTVPADQGGTYRLRVAPIQGSGRYLLRVAGATGDGAQPVRVVGSSIADGTTLGTWPSSITIDFDSPLLAKSVTAADFTINGSMVDGVNWIDGDTLSLDITNRFGGDGQYRIEIAAGVVSGIYGTTNLAHAIGFVIDSTSPVVTAVSHTDGAIIAPGPLSFTATFNEALDGSVLGTEDVSLINTQTGAKISAQSLTYDAANFTATVGFGVLPEGAYELRLSSGVSGFRDTLGNRLNGGPSFPLPSGQGNPSPDDFVVSFAVDATGQTPAPVPLRETSPLGGMGFDSGWFRGALHHGSDVDTFQIALEAGQSVSVILEPESMLRGAIELRGTDDAIIASATATRDGERIVLNLGKTTSAGVHTLRISGVGGSSGGYRLWMSLNLVPPPHITGATPNLSRDSAMSLDGGAVSVGNGIERTGTFGVPNTVVGGTVSLVSGVTQGVSLQTIRDGIFVPRGQFWMSDTVHWTDPTTTLEVTFDSPQELAGARIQADTDATYQLDWFDAASQTWKPLWSIPNYSTRIGSGMVTRPDHPTTDPNKYVIFPTAVTTQRLRFRAVSGDGTYSISELDLLAPSYYSITLPQGGLITNVVTSQGSAAVAVDLLDADGKRLVTGTGGIGSSSQSINNFVAPQAGKYFLRVVSEAPHSLLVVRDGVFDVEPNDADARSIPLGANRVALGHLWRTSAEGFEPGTLPTRDWTLGNVFNTGRTQVSGDHGAAVGTQALLMDSQQVGAAAINEATMTLDLAGATTASLSFSHRTFGNESSNSMPSSFSLQAPLSDGVAFSVDGQVWYRLWSPTLSTSWSTVTVDLVEQARLRGVQLNERVQIRFQQYGDQVLPSGGRGWDDITVTTDAHRDLYRFAAKAGDTLVIETTTPGSAPNEPPNGLVPRLELIAPGGQSLANNTGGAADGRNALIRHTADADGDYTIRVLADSGWGAYTVKVLGSSAMTTFVVTGTTPETGVMLGTFPQTLRVRFSDPLLLRSIDADDLKVTRPDGGVASATSVTVIDGQTLEFRIDNAFNGEGVYEVAIAAGALTSASGLPLTQFAGSLKYDNTPPTVTQTSVAEGGVVSSGELTLVFRFSEPISQDGLFPEDVTLTDLTTQATFTPSSVSYDATSRELSVSYTALPEGNMRVRLASSPSAIRDIAGNLLDGNADGSAGDDFVLNFITDKVADQPLAINPLQPLGSMTLSGSATGIFHQAGDVDTYSVNLGVGETVSVWLSPTKGDFVGSIEVVDPSGEVIGSATATGAGKATLLQTAAVRRAGIHRVRTIAGSANGEYALQVYANAALSRAGFLGESLDTLAKAQPIDASSLAFPPGSDRLSVVGRLGTAPELYRFDSTSDRFTSIVLANPSGIPNASDAQIELLDASGNVIAIGTAAGFNAARRIDNYLATTGSVHYVRVTGTAGSAFQLTVFRGSQFEQERNNATTAANPIGRSGQVVGSLSERPFAGGETSFLETTFAAGNGADGNMFNLTTFGSPVLVTALDVHANSSSNSELLVYIRAGGYEGFTSTASGWTLVSSNRINGQGSGIRTPVDVTDFLLQPNTVYGIYITTTGSGLSYTNGTTSYQNDFFRIDAGLGKSYPFGSNFSPRIWNGRVYFDTADREDWYSFNAVAGDDIILETFTGTFGRPVPDMKLELFGPDGALVVAADGGAADGFNVRLAHKLATTGRYTVRATTTQSLGDYGLRLNGSTAALSPLTVAQTNPAADALLVDYPSTYDVVFSEPLLLTSVAATDLTINGQPATGVTIVDAKTLRFDITGLVKSDGLYRVEIAAGSILALSGTPVSSFTTTFDSDKTNPKVTESSITKDAVLPPGRLVYVAKFSEAMATEGLGAEDVVLRETLTGATVIPEAFVYNPLDQTVTVTYGDVPEGTYKLSLLTSATAFRDRRGNLLDGDGNGTGGDPYELDFSVDRGTAAFPLPLIVTHPAGSLVHTTSSPGVIGRAGDIDNFTLDIDAGESFTVVTRPSGSQLSLRVRVLAPDGSVIATGESATLGGSVALQSLNAQTGGTYTIEVTGANGSGAYNIGLVLNAAVESESISAAGNGTIATAEPIDAYWRPLGNGGQRLAVLGTVAGDPDLFRVNLSAGQRIHWVVGDPEGRLSSVELLDANGVLLAIAEPYRIEKTFEIPRFIAPRSGDYFLRINGSSAYTLLVTQAADFESGRDVYTTDFASGSDPNWSTTSTDASSAEFTRFLGRFANNSATLTLPTEPGVAYAIDFDLMIIDTWDGNGPSSGPDFFNVEVAGNVAFRHTFTTSGQNQSYPFAPDLGGRNFGWGAANDAVYRNIRVNFVATAAQTPIRFFGSDLQGINDESWGIDNVRLRALAPIGNDRVLGHLDRETDRYPFFTSPGDKLFLYTTTPGDGPLQPPNDLDTSLRLYDQEGLLVGLGETGAPQNDGRNAAISYTVPAGAGGMYFVDVSGTGRGAYVLHLSGAATPAGVAPRVVATNPANDQPLVGPPTSIELTFSEPLLIDTISPQDLTIDGGASVTGIEIIDSRKVRFLVNVPAAQRAYTYTLAAGTLFDLQGVGNEAFVGRFVIDGQGPRVIAQAPATQASAPFGKLTFEFDEPINAASFTTSDITSFLGPGGTNLLAQVTGVSVQGNVATVTFQNQTAQGTYVMRIGPNISDRVGNLMDQNGNGTNGESADTYIGTVNLQSADLGVTGLTLPSQGTFGSQLTVGWTVSNLGSDPAAEGWKDQLWLSRDLNLDAADTPLLATPLEPPSGTIPLAAGASYPRSVDVTLPLSIALNPGVYYVLVKTDAENRQAENNESNNVRGEAITLALPPLPDLVVSRIDAPTEAFSGQRIVYSWTLSNLGTVAATGTWTDRVVLSSDTSLGNDLLLGDFAFTGTIAPGETVTRTQSYDLPIDLQGDRWFIVQTDFRNNVFEHVGDQNNVTVATAPTKVKLSPFPNLQVTRVDSPAEAFSSQQTLIEWTVTNTGTGSTSAPLWYDKVWLSLDDRLDSLDTVLGSVQNANFLPAGEAYRNQFLVTLPRGIQGDYWFIVETDATDRVFESTFEGDNDAAGIKTRVKLTPPPDLKVKEIKGPDVAFSFQKVPITWTVINDDTTQGAGGRTAEKGWHDRIVLSSSATEIRNPITLATIGHQGALGPGESYTQTAEVTIPVGVEGEWYVFVTTDAFSDVFEHIFEGNNTEVRRDESTQPRPTRITLTPPDLEVDVVTVPAVAAAGRSMRVSFDVTNYGVAATPNTSWIDSVYLSLDQTLDPSDRVIGSIYRYGALDVFGSENATYSQSDDFQIPLGLSGDFFVLVKTDAPNSVFEGPAGSLGESNNVKSSRAAVRVVSNPPDLIVVPGSFVVPTNVDAGAVVRASWIERNQGTGSVGTQAWLTRVFASTDATPSDDDTIIATFNRNVDLPAGQQLVWTDQAITIPIGLSGTRHFYVRVDAAQQIFEGEAEGNNTSAPIAVAIRQQVADLQVVSIAPIPGPVVAGSRINVSWVVKNFGNAETNALSWEDRVVLSKDDTIDTSDLAIGSFTRSAPLGPDGSYTATLSVLIPPTASGQYFLGVITDVADRVFEGAGEGNNTRSRGMGTNQGDPDDSGPIGSEDPSKIPDLELIGVNAPIEAYTGQPFELSWTVRNNGDTAGGLWYDQVYLSLDQVFDPQDDISLGVDLILGMAAGATVSRSEKFVIPRGLAGPYYVFVITDSTNRVRESNEWNNIRYDRDSMLVNLTPPADLVIGTITIPANASPGMNASITYRVDNRGQDLALGQWYDSVFISTDTTWDIGDALFGRALHVGNVAGGSHYTKTVQGPLPGLLPGDYHVIVRSDIFNQVVESDDTNNIGASIDRVDIDLALLELGKPISDQLDPGRAVFFRTEPLVAGETVRLRFDGPAEAFGELYVSFGEMPNRNRYDFAANQPFLTRQEIILPVEKSGVYYVTAYRSEALQDRAYTISADIIPFSVSAVAANRVGNSGPATLKISGARFNPATQFFVMRDGFQPLPTDRLMHVDSATVFATFDFAGIEPGVYTIGAYDPANDLLAILKDALTVTVGQGYEIDTLGRGPAAVAANRINRFDVEFGNIGDADTMPPLIVLKTSTQTPMGFTPSTIRTTEMLQVLGAPSEGPLDTMRPGSIETENIFYRSGESRQPIDIRVTYVTADDPTLMRTADWDAIRIAVKPASIDEPQWNAFWANIPSRVGNTWGQYVRFLNHLQGKFATPGNPQRDVTALFESAYRFADDFLPSLVASGQLLGAQDGLPMRNIDIALYSMIRGEYKKVGGATTDAQGRFQVPFIQDGSYELAIDEDYAFDQDRDNSTDAMPPILNVLPQTDLAGGVFYAMPLERIQTLPSYSQPSLATDAAGASQIIYAFENRVWHARHNGTAWVDAKPISEGQGVGLRLRAARNLLGGTEPGLIATWSEGIKNDEEVLFSVGRPIGSGRYQWSPVQRLTNDQVQDVAPDLVVLPDGTAIVAYVKEDVVAKDDRDLYFKPIRVNHALFPSDMLTSSDPLLAQEVSGSIKYSETFKDPFGLFEDEVSIEGDVSLSGCDLSASVTGENTLTINNKSSSGSVSASGNWTANPVSCNWEPVNAEMSFGVGISYDWEGGLFRVLKAIPQTSAAAYAAEGILELAALVTRSEFSNGIVFSGSLSSDLSWSGKAPFPDWIMPDAGTLKAEFGLSPYVRFKVTEDVGVEFSGEISVETQLLPTLKVEKVTGSLTAEFGIGWGFTLGGTYSFDFYGGSGLDVNGMSTLNTDPNDIKWVYNPTAAIGTGNVYGNNSIIADITKDLWLDTPASLTVGADGLVHAAWFKSHDPLVTAGGDVVWATFDGTKWSAPIALPGSFGISRDVELTTDGQGRVIAAWTTIDANLVSSQSTSEEVEAARDSNDVRFAIFEGGQWSLPQAVMATTGGDASLDLTTLADGTVAMAWVNKTGPESQRLLSTTLSGNLFSTPLTIASGRNLNEVAIGQIGTDPVLFWSATVDPNDDATTLFSSRRTGMTWSDPARFDPVLMVPESVPQNVPQNAPQDVSQSDTSTRDDVMYYTSLFGCEVPEDCCKCDEVDTEYRGSDQGCGFTVEYDQENCKKIIIYKPCVPPPVDPNDILGPDGYGEQNWIRADQAIPYKIRFENDPVFAKAPAQKVVITQTLDPDLDFRSFRLGDFGFGDLFFQVPANRAFHSQRLDLTETRGFFVDFTAGIDIATGTITWTLTTIDPATGEQPLDPFVGFLSINDDKASGEGFVNYSIRPKRTVVSGDVVDAEARIFFDSEAPVDTPPIFHTLDASKPISAVKVLPVQASGNTFSVNWGGEDESTGSGLAAFNVFVSENGQAFRPWLLGTQLRSAEFVGATGARYAFYSVAFDNAGNPENAPEGSDSETLIPGAQAVIGDRVWRDSDADGVQDPGEPGEPGVTVKLYFTTSPDPAMTAVTDAEGLYRFPDLDPTASYFLEFVAPSGFAFTRNDAGSDDAIDSDPDRITGRTPPFTPLSGDNFTWDAGLIELASISGSVWRDSNADGIRGGNEPLLTDQSVYLDLDGDSTWDADEPSMKTDAQGSFKFDGLRPGLHVVRQILPTGWEQTHPGSGGATAVTLTNSDIPLFTPELTSAVNDLAALALDPDLPRQILMALAEAAATILPLGITTDPRDVNRDGAISPVDAILVINALAGNDRLATMSLGERPAGLADAARRLVGLDSLRADTRFGNLDGRGMSVVIIDTGLDVDHPFFGADRDGNGVADRILYQYDFADGDADAGDTSGHGTHVSSIIASQDPAYPGIAPGVGIIHLKVFSNGGRGNFGNLEKALQWVIDQSAARNIAAVNLSLGDGQNWSQAVGLYGITDELDALDRLGVITVAAAGNSFATFGGAEGLAYPAADPNVISVGAVWDADRGRQDFGNLGIDLSTAADRIAGFSQRDRDLLDGLAPGALITAAANGGGVATMRGTSMAAPFVTGAAVLAQQLATERYGARLNTAQFRELLQRSAVRLIDGDDEQTNVPATEATYHRLDLMSLADSLWIAGPPKTADANPGNAGNGNGSIGTLNGAFAYFVQLAQGQDREGIDFGIRPIPQPPPKVTANVIQGGMSQRSFVDRVEIDFSTRVNLDDLIRSGAITGAVSLVNLGITADSDPDQSVPLNANQFRYEFDATSGRSRLTWSLDAFSNATQSLPNGFYRLRLATSMITDADGQPLVGNQGSADFDITFLRLQGDADGTGRVNADDMTMVNRALNATPASSSWNANADLDRDGRVTVRDRVLVARATGSSITPPALGSGLGVSSLDAPPEIALSWLDLNRDGIVSALDALRVINHFHQAAYPIAPTAEIADSAMDLDFDGEFDLDDAGQVLRHLADRSGTKSLAFDLALSQQPDWHPGDWLD